jgi:predicted porin
MQTSYLNGQVYGARLSKDILKGKIYGSLNYRWVKFDYVSSVSQLKQNIGEIDFSYQFNKKLYLSFNYEATFQKNEHFNRLYLNLRVKF